MAKLLAAPTKNAIQKTLAAELLSTATTGDPITFADVDGIPNLPGVLVIDRIDSAGTATPSKREYIEYSGTSGSTVLITTRNVDGSSSAQTHAVGAIVEFIPDVVWADRIYDALSNIINVNDVSALASGITLQSPSLVSPNIPLSTGWFNSSGATITAIADEDDMASDSATKVPTQQSVKAYADSLVVTDLTPKNGWINATGTWTYASATTITVPSGAASIYQIGDKIKITQTTPKYFYVTAVADTLLTVTGGSTYTVANAAITSPQYSKVSNPQGFPGWFSWSPTIAYSGGTTDPTSNTPDIAKFSVEGRTLTFIFHSALVVGTGNRTTTTITLPINPIDGNFFSYNFCENIVTSTVTPRGCWNQNNVVTTNHGAMTRNGEYMLSGHYKI